MILDQETIVSYVPTMIGFTPTDSVVVIAMRGNGVIFGARVDNNDLEEAWGSVDSALVNAEADSVVLLAYSDDPNDNALARAEALNTHPVTLARHVPNEPGQSRADIEQLWQHVGGEAEPLREVPFHLEDNRESLRDALDSVRSIATSTPEPDGPTYAYAALLAYAGGDGPQAGIAADIAVGLNNSPLARLVNAALVKGQEPLPVVVKMIVMMSEQIEESR